MVRKMKKEEICWCESNILNKMKKIFIRIRTSLKLIIIISIATFLITGVVAFVYKPIYSVTLDGELIGYCRGKIALQTRIDEYIEKGDGQNSNVAFVKIDKMPEYKLCLGQRDIEVNEEEIFNKVKSTGVTYYKYFAILEDDEEKIYVSDFDTAEKVVSTLEEKESTNIDNIQILEKYETELKEFATEEDAVSSLYKQKVVVQPKVNVATAKKTTTYRASSGGGNVITSTNISQAKVSLGITLIKPVSGMITSRFGARSSIRSSAHTGLDIATSKGTPIVAAASGTVTFAGYKGSYGYLVVISHANGVQTYYGHCSKLYVSVGDKVAQGSKIAAVGSTGNSTGPHLHLEVRVNGMAYNPQNYLY